MKNPPVSSASDGRGDLIAGYDGYFDMLVAAASDRFGVPEEVARRLAEEVLLSFLHRSAKTADPDQWLLGAMATTCRRYLESAMAGEAR